MPMHYKYSKDEKTRLAEYKTRLEVLRSRLEVERSSFDSHWQAIGSVVRPTRIRFIQTDTNEGHRRNQNIIDSTATLAERTLRAGMMAGLSSPARPWFNLSLWDTETAQKYNVRTWLDDVEKSMRHWFLRSNLYQVLPLMYGDAGTFGTACVYMQRHPETVSRFYSFPIGSYYLANDGYGNINTFVRNFQFTVRQIVDLFATDANGNVDLSMLSSDTAVLFERGHLDTWIDCVHVVKENDFYNARSKLSMHKMYSSDYYEQGPSNIAGNFVSTTSQKTHKFLQRSGYDYFPILAPRWEVTGEDVYGTNCPGMVALGDIRQLQQGELTGLEALDKMVRPPLVGPSSMRRKNAAHLPGSITYLDEREGVKGLRSIYDTNFRIDLLDQKQQEVRRRIQRSYYEDLFLMLSGSDRRQITAREVEERHTEKLLATGPVLEQLNEDFFDPLINNQFQMMIDEGVVPPAPEEIQGQELRIEYVSIMAQAQRLTGLGGIERLTDFVTKAAAIDQSVVDYYNTDQVVKDYAEIVGVEAKSLNSEEDVIEIRAARDKARQQQMAMEQQAQTAQDAKTMSETPVDGGTTTALDRLQRQGLVGT